MSSRRPEAQLLRQQPGPGGIHARALKDHEEAGADRQGQRCKRRGPEHAGLAEYWGWLGLELPPGRRAAALQVRYADRNFLITCDKVIGPRTIVVPPPGPLIGLIPFYAGVTASGAGKAQLVLDLGALADVAYSGISSTSTPRRGQPRVLVVDDSRLAREAVARLLATAGYQAVAAQDGRRMAGKPGRSWASAVSTPWSPCWKCHVSTAFQPATTTVPKKQATSRNVSPRLWKRIYLFDWTVGSDTIPASQGIFGLIPRLSFRAIFWIRSMASITD